MMQTGYADLETRLSLAEEQLQELNNKLLLSQRENDFLRLTYSAQVSLANDASTEKELQKVYIKLLLKSCPDIMFLLDRDMRFLLVTDSIKNILDVEDVETLQGQTLSTVIDEYKSPFFTPSLIINIAYSNRISDLAYIPLEINAEGCTYNATIWPSGQNNYGFVGVLVVMHNVTELINARKEAERASSMKSDFLSHVSHELRTPLTSVLGVSEIQLQDTSLAPQTEEAFLHIFNSSNLLMGIVNDVLDFSKIEAGKIDLVEKEYDVAGFISDVTHQRHAFMGSKEIDFKLHISENMPTMLVGDKLRIEQVINNILSNAIKYTEDGEIELDMMCEPVGSDVVTLVITISDTGVGMTPEELDSVFDAYTRFNENDRGYVAGTGLGMTIANNLLQLMNGTIDMQSAVGEGTTVTVKIPQRVSDNEVLGESIVSRLQQFDIDVHNNLRRASFIPEPMPYGKVLVVDDIEANLLVSERLLAFYDIQIDTCDSGYAAVEKVVQGNVYDIILMDHMMPGMDGIQAMQAMRDNGYTNTIMVFTANALIGNVDKFIKAGFDGFISKPINTSHLHSLLVKHIKSKQSESVIDTAIAGGKNKNTAHISIDEALVENSFAETLRKNFVQRHQKTAQDLQQAIDAGDILNAHIIAHSLKGAASLIDERKLSGIAQKVENLLGGNSLPHHDMLITLESELSEVLSKIGTIQDAPLCATKDVDIAKLLEEIIPLLKRRNAESQNYLNTLRHVPEAKVLARQIEDFEFAAALKSATELYEDLST